MERLRPSKATGYDLSCGKRLDEVALTILEIHKADQGATAFRYAIRCDQDPQFEKHGVVHIPVLIERMASAADFFERLLDDMVKEKIRMDEAIRDAVARDRSFSRLGASMGRTCFRVSSPRPHPARGVCQVGA